MRDRSFCACLESPNIASESSPKCAACSMAIFCVPGSRPSRPRSAMASCACCVAFSSSCTQPLLGSLTNRPVACARLAKSFLVSFSPSSSHSAETDNQSMPLPFTTNFGLRRLGLRNRRWKESLPRNSASSGRSSQTLASTCRKFSFASPIHKPGSGVNQSNWRSQFTAGSRRSSSSTCGRLALRRPVVMIFHSCPVHSHWLVSLALACKRSSSRSPCSSNTNRGCASSESHNLLQSTPSL